jgi:tetratricopeptide (TPR) repeat protein
MSNDVEKSETLVSISGEMAKQGKAQEAASTMQEAIESARAISAYFKKNDTLVSISRELAKQGRIQEAASTMQEAIESARTISDDTLKSQTLKSISGELAKQGKIQEAASTMQEAIESALAIRVSMTKGFILVSISGELAKQGKIQEALECARTMSEDNNKSEALVSISGELANLGNWQLAESTVMEITHDSKMHGFWKSTAKNTFKNIGWQKAIQRGIQLESDVARLFYLKGWAEAVTIAEADAVCIGEALNYIVHDSESIETLLQKYALHELFLGDASKEQINRLNHTLNIQWAMEIQGNFSSTKEHPRLSTNVDDWLQIVNEDVSARVELWAVEVGKGKMTEEEFNEKLRKME